MDVLYPAKTVYGLGEAILFAIIFVLHKSELSSMSEMGSLNPPLFFLIVDYLCLLQKNPDSYAFYMNLQ